MKLIRKYVDNRITHFATTDLMVQQDPAVLWYFRVVNDNFIIYLFGRRIYFSRRSM